MLLSIEDSNSDFSLYSRLLSNIMVEQAKKESRI